MSSTLAGALGSPSQLSEPYESAGEDADGHNRAMSPPSDSVAAKEEDDEAGGADLFGEDEDVDYVKHTRASTQSLGPEEDDDGDGDGLTESERQRRQALEYAEDDEEPNPLTAEHPLLVASVSVPNIPLPQSSDGQHWVLRLPNFLRLDAKPFHPDTYIGPEHEDSFARGTRERDMVIKLRVENTIRWRWTKDAHGRDRRQTNARVIRWSDGSSSLRVGKEYFDMSHVIDNSGSAHRQAFGTPSSSQPAQQASQAGGRKHGLTYLVAQHKRAEILQAAASIVGHITIRPTDMASDTHRLLVRAVGQKHSKVARLRIHNDAHKEHESALQEQRRAAAKRPRRPRGESAPRRRRSSGSGRRRAGEDLWSDEDDDEHEYAGSDEDAARRRAAEDRRGGGEYQTDDFLVADSDEEDGGGGGHGGRRKRARAEPDELDRLEAKIEAARKGHSDEDADVDAEGEDEMDVESEDEEDVRVRKGHGGTRKRRAIEEEEEGL